ncbi:MAG: hypothetical protein Ta2G_13210 [Termitinemataceae bacterium]|nr:MAG: hypothetical protein Ta2G_13210 [Termitinemataceae bacterium]
MSSVILIITATTRTAHAIVVFGALLWVFIFCTALQYLVTKTMNGKSKNERLSKSRIKILNILISSFVASVFYLLLFIVNPFLAMESVLWIMIIPVLYCASPLLHEVETEDTLTKVLTQTISLGMLIMLIALIREPLGYAALSIPGGTQGIIELFNIAGEYPLPVQVMSNSAGAFLLLAYLLIVLRYLNTGNEISRNSEVDSE